MVHPVEDAGERSLYGSLTADQFYDRHSVTHGSEFITNSRGLKLFTQWWMPRPPIKPIGIIAKLHYFTGESSWFIQLTAVHFTKAGFITCAIDYQGHGFSEGLQHHIPDINPVVDDCISFFDSFRGRHARSLPSFLYGESLGGAIALLITLRRTAGSRPWSGMVLSGAMCGINAKFKPPWPLEHLLSPVAALVPTWRVVPTCGTVQDLLFKVHWKRNLALASPRCVMARPRAATALELNRVCKMLQKRFHEVEVPLLISQGGDDMICDPACAEELYRRAASEDKTLKIYPGMWHLMVGEPKENVELVFGDKVKWLHSRAAAFASTTVAGEE